MSESPNLVVVKKWLDSDGHEKDSDGDWYWPHPPEYIESRVEGNLRLDILRRLGRAEDDPAVIHIIEGEIEGGYSEYTVEVDYDIEVWIHEARQKQRVYETSGYMGRDGTFDRFMKWIEAAS